MTIKKCSKCNIVKEGSEYHKDSSRKNGLDSYCMSCRKIMRIEQKPQRKVARDKWYKENRERLTKSHREWSYTGSGAYSALKARGKRREISVKISRDVFIKWWDEQNKICHYCGIPEDVMYTLGWNYRYTRMSIDRKDNNLGYTIDNIVLACMTCNMVKSSIFTYDEMMTVIAPLLTKKWECAFDS